MKKNAAILAMLAFLLVGCNEGSGGGSNPPIKDDSFTVTWKNYDGSILEIDEKVPSGSIPSYDGNTPIRDKTENYEYTFSKWSPELTPIVADTTFVAQFDSTLTAAFVTFDLNGGTTQSNSQSRYMPSIEAEYFFFDVKKENYNFNGWYYNGNKIFDDKGNKINNADIAETMTFKALFAEILYYTIHFETNGGNPIDDLVAEKDDSISVNPSRDGYSFVGWYTDSSCSLSSYFELGNTMPAFNGTLYAKWTEMYNTVFEIDSKQYMYFGSYPQSIVQDTNIKAELNKITTTNTRGYYEYNGDEYAKQYVNAYSSSYTYSNGSKVNSNSTEYFKVEPILWRVLTSDSSGNYTLLADQAINSHQYDSSSNNYANSEIRGWLNNDFFNIAFKTAEKASILTTTVDNSPSSTKSNTNPYACENTSDKVFLLSYKDYFNPAYGFSSSYDGCDSARYCKPTDYAIANHCYMSVGSPYDRNCFYWTRSPDPDYSNVAWYVENSGGLYFYDGLVGSEGDGVRPALNINL